MIRRFTFAAMTLLYGLVLSGCAGGAQPTASSPAEALVQTKCSACHTLDRVEAADYDRATWESTVSRMEVNGLVISDDEKQEIVDYLAERDTAD